MIVEYIHYDLDERDVASFEDAVATAAAALAADEGCRAWELTRRVARAGTYVLRVDWESVEAIDAFKATNGFASVGTALSPFSRVAGPPILYSVVNGSAAR